ncbi:hypothetical protein [Streptomyces sp. bgisy031]|uniref:hypothetical protein n=1 Tax=Streptomyces sp. bgisy031 TaxID=3413772 RepID=UPI003D73531D
MSAGGFCKLPNGRVVVALTVPSPSPDDGAVRVLVHAANRARALTRLRNLGLRAIYLRGNAEPPTPDEITAVLHHPDGLLWRAAPRCAAGELWHPIRALMRPRHPDRAVHSSRSAGPGSPGSSGSPGFSGSPSRGYSGHSSPSGV